MNALESDVRDELLAMLQELSQAVPEMRLGQLIVNLSYFAREPAPEATWDVEDEELLTAARRLLENRTQRTGE